MLLLTKKRAQFLVSALIQLKINSVNLSDSLSEKSVFLPDSPYVVEGRLCCRGAEQTLVFFLLPLAETVTGLCAASFLHQLASANHENYKKRK